MNNALSLRTADVLRSLRELPPREQLHIVTQILPEIEREFPRAASTDRSFWRHVDIQTLADRQGVRPIDDLNRLSGSWPEDESVDDFLAALREWHGQSLV